MFKIISLFLVFFLVEDGKKPQWLKDLEALKTKTEKQIEKLSEGVDKKYDAAKTEAEKEKVIEAYLAEQSALAEPAYLEGYKLLKDHMAEPAAAEGLAWVHSTKDEKIQAEVREALRKHHLVHPATMDLVKAYRGDPKSWVEPMLREQLAAKDLPEKSRPMVLLTLAMHIQKLSSLPALYPHYKETFEKEHSAERLKQILNFDVPKMEAEAVKLFEEIIAKYPKVEVIPEFTMGDVAKGSIYEIQNLSIGKPVPEIEGEDQDGVKFKLSDFQGKVTLISFWASWCGPCMAEVPFERGLVEKYSKRPFVLIGVNGDMTREDLKKAIVDNKISWRSFWAGSKGPFGPIPVKWNVNGWPTTYLVDHRGIIRAKMLLGKALEGQIEILVKAAESK
jgi:thiol-disulfide isomerase/thioredoxin